MRITPYVAPHTITNIPAKATIACAAARRWWIPKEPIKVARPPANTSPSEMSPFSDCPDSTMSERLNTAWLKPLTIDQ